MPSAAGGNLRRSGRALEKPRWVNRKLRDERAQNRAGCGPGSMPSNGPAPSVKTGDPLNSSVMMTPWELSRQRGNVMTRDLELMPDHLARSAFELLSVVTPTQTSCATAGSNLHTDGRRPVEPQRGRACRRQCAVWRSAKRPRSSPLLGGEGKQEEGPLAGWRTSVNPNSAAYLHQFLIAQRHKTPGSRP